MARYKDVDSGMNLLAVDLSRQLLPGTFEHALSHLLDHELDLSHFDAYYNNDVTGSSAYLRGLLTLGARSTLQSALKREPQKRSRLEQWIVALRGRVGYHKTVVAIANKHMRMIWAILAKGEAYDPNAWRRYQQQKADASA